MSDESRHRRRPWKPAANSSAAGGWLRRALLLTALVVVLPAVEAAKASATEQVVYTHRPCPTCVPTLWRADENGANRAQISSDPVIQQAPALSPDGQQVAYVNTQYDIYITDIRGTQRRLVYDSSSFSITGVQFAPDGNRLVFGDSTDGTSATYDVYVIDTDGANRRVLIGGTGCQNGAAFSPNGQKIIFTDGNTKKYRCDVENSKVITANSDGTGRTTILSAQRHVGGYSWSPDGTQISFVRGTPVYGDLFVMNANGTNARQLTTTLVGEGGTTWSPDRTNPKIMFDRESTPVDTGTNGGTFTMRPDGTGETQVLASPGPCCGTFRKIRSLAAADYAGLLADYVPMLRYDSQELYFADSAATITDNPGNTLWSNGSVIATAGGSPALGLDFLGWPQYSNGQSASENDHIDEVNTYSDDAQRMHAISTYANKIYGRAKQDAATGQWWLQYWLFYYYNPQEVLGIGVHEGDWEMVQFRLDANGAPDLASYAQHSGGETCVWNIVEKTWVGSRYVPVVYVANASHASYFTPGPHSRFPLPTDEANGQSPNSTRPFSSQISDTGPNWALWQGRWGGSSDGSPRGPIRQGAKWTDPGTWAQGLPCDSLGSGMSLLSRRLRSKRVSPGTRTQAPTVGRIVQRGKQLKVPFRLRGTAGRESTRGPVTVAVTVHPDRRRYAPSGKVRLVRSRTGTVTVPMPAVGGGPYTVRVSAAEDKAARSRMVVRTVGR